MANEAMIFEHQVKLGGWLVDASWEISRSMNNVPVIGGEGGAATCRLTNVSISAGIMRSKPMPWNAADVWPPKPGTPVTVDVREAGTDTWHRQFTGVTDAVEGGTNGVYQIDCVDRIDRLTRQLVSWPLQRFLPPEYDDGDYRHVNVHQNWYYDLAAYYAGFNTKFPFMENVTMYASMAGSLWAYHGVAAFAKIGTNIWSSVYDSDDGWGVGMTDFEATYTVNYPPLRRRKTVAYIPIASGATAATTYRFCFFDASALVGPDTSKDAYIVVKVNADRSVEVSTRWGLLRKFQPSEVTNLFTIVREDYSDGASLGRLTIGTGSSKQSFDTIAALGPLDSVVVSAPKGARAGGFAVCEPPSDYVPTFGKHNQAAKIEPHWSISGMNASRDCWYLQCRTVLDRLSATTFAHYGIDEEGIFHVIPFFKRFTTPPQYKLVDDTDVYEEIAWKSDWKNAATKVIAKYRKPQCRVWPYHGIDIWQGTTTTLSPGIGIEAVIHPESEWDWIMPNLDSSLANGGDTLARVNRGRGNVFMASVEVPSSGGETTYRVASGSEVETEMRRLDPRSFFVNIKNVRSAGDIVTVAARDVKWLTPWVWNKAMPIIRAKGTTQWIDTVYESKDAGIDAQTVEVDYDDWAGDNVQFVTDSLANMYADSMVTFDSLQIRPRPSMRLSDSVLVEMTELQVLVQGVITGVHTRFSEDSGLSQEIDLTTTAHLAGSGYWNDFEVANASRTWSGTETAYNGKTWQDLEMNPRI